MAPFLKSKRRLRNEIFSLNCCRDPRDPAAGVLVFVRQRRSIAKTARESVHDVATRCTRRKGSQRVAEADRKGSGAEEGMLYRELPGQAMEGSPLRPTFKVSEHRRWHHR